MGSRTLDKEGKIFVQIQKVEVVHCCMDDNLIMELMVLLNIDVLVFAF